MVLIEKEKIMMLLTAQNRKSLPALYSQDGKGMDAIAQVKFFCPWNSWTWYASEFDGNDTFFGLVCGFEDELGPFSLKELQSVRGQFGLGIERDMHWTPRPLKDCKGS